MPTPEDLAIARTAFAEAAEPIFRRDLFDLVPQRYVDELVDHPGAGGSPERALILAATRLIWCLAKSGELCLAHKQGAEQAYVLRRHWVPELPWPAECDPVEAATDLARRYLRSFAPATPADMAHFFGSKVGTVRVWLEGLELVLADVTCGDRRGLLALAEDLEELAAEPPAAVREWPLRLLPQWDLHTMTHKDKSWVVPHRDDLQLVWRKAAVNAPTVVVRGRFVATWSHRTTTRRVFVKVSPLSGWRARFRSGVEREAKELAAHLGLEEVEIELA